MTKIKNLLIKFGLIEIIAFESKLSKVEFIDIFSIKVRNDSSWQLYYSNNFQFSKYKYRGYILDDFFKLTFETGSNSNQANYGGFCEGEIIELNDKIQLKILF